MKLEKILRDYPLMEEEFKPKEGTKGPIFRAQVSRHPDTGKILYIKPGFGEFLKNR